MKVPLSWLRSYLDDPLPPLAEFRTRITLAGSRSRRSSRRGPPEQDGATTLVGRRTRARGRPAPERRPAAALPGRHRRRRAAPDRLRRMQLRRRRHGRGRAARRAPADGPQARACEAPWLALGRHDPVGARARALGRALGDPDPRRGLPPGEPLASRVPLGEVVIDFEILSNRSDLLSVCGVARDVAAVFDLRLRPLDETRARGAAGRAPRASSCRSRSRIRPSARASRRARCRACASGRRRSGCKARLTRRGIRPISNVVDVTNYVRTTSASRCTPTTSRASRSQLVARPGASGREDDDARRQGARARPRDARDRARRRPVGHRGRDGRRRLRDRGRHDRCRARGGARSTASRSSARPAGSVCAPRPRTGSRRASTRGSPRSPTELPHASSSRSRARPSHPSRSTCTASCPSRSGSCCAPGACWPSRGSHVGLDESAAILGRLGFAVEPHDDGLRVRPPSWRLLDVTREIDVVEEVARIHGLEHVPATPAGADPRGRPQRRPAASPPADEALARRRPARGHDDQPRRPRISPTSSAWPRTTRAERPSCCSTRSPAEHAAMRTLLLPSLQPRRSGTSRRPPRARALRDRARLPPARRGGAARRAVDARRARRRARRIVLHREGHPRDRLGAVGIGSSSSPAPAATRSCTRGARRGSCVGGEQAGEVGELHPALVDRMGLPRPGGRRG